MSKQEIIRINLDGVNAYLLKSDKGFVLVDTGGHLIKDKEFTDRCNRLEQALLQAGCNADNLRLILLTHGDNDHVCNAAYLKDKYNTQIAMDQKDAYLVERLEARDYMKSFQYHSIVYKLFFKVMRKTIQKVADNVIADFRTFHPDIFIDETFQLSDYGSEGQIIALPGHTPGSIGILTPSGDFIAGDTLSNLNKPELAINAYDFEQLSHSVSKLKNYEIHTIYPGHGEPFSWQSGEVFFKR